MKRDYLGSRYFEIFGCKVYLFYLTISSIFIILLTTFIILIIISSKEESNTRAACKADGLKWEVVDHRTRMIGKTLQTYSVWGCVE